MLNATGIFVNIWFDKFKLNSLALNNADALRKSAVADMKLASIISNDCGQKF